ncbi:endonuclease/exonuclease/phosphatase family protein [Desertivirga arenae]|uniref:endonuclease/exonuclease/phosphatase family protein n=1 Tax=Desertivirga arenae TaxID=2810309 RepID=UPI001F606201|nr:endonuclease/exonuclease/phosphatase family protein [Pedobacter sp. SYSU D00823]
MATSIKYILEILASLVLTMSLLPLVRNDYWAFRVFEYPRFQKLILTALLLIAFIVKWLTGDHESSIIIFSVLLSCNLVYLFYQIYPFLSVAKVQVKHAREVFQDKGISLITANVYQYNRNDKEYIQNLESQDADIMLLLETDSWWQNALSVLKEKYPYSIEVPLENTYGMMLFSKLKFEKYSVEYLVEKDIPSIHCRLILPSGKKVQLYCVHPTPPVPNENPRSTERDKELLLVGKLARKNDLPVIVMGDLNDVAWSYTTELFSKYSGLLDPRKGRGFFNTFHAWYPFLRFPLDHVFCSVDFKLLEIRKLAACGSDHFPMFLKLQYENTASLEQEEPKPDAEEKELAEEKIAKKAS